MQCAIFEYWLSLRVALSWVLMHSLFLLPKNGTDYQCFSQCFFQPERAGFALLSDLVHVIIRIPLLWHVNDSFILVSVSVDFSSGISQMKWQSIKPSWKVRSNIQNIQTNVRVFVSENLSQNMSAKHNTHSACRSVLVCGRIWKCLVRDIWYVLLQAENLSERFRRLFYF